MRTSTVALLFVALLLGSGECPWPSGRPFEARACLETASTVQAVCGGRGTTVGTDLRRGRALQAAGPAPTPSSGRNRPHQRSNSRLTRAGAAQEAAAPGPVSLGDILTQVRSSHRGCMSAPCAARYGSPVQSCSPAAGFWGHKTFLRSRRGHLHAQDKHKHADHALRRYSHFTRVYATS